MFNQFWMMAGCNITLGSLVSQNKSRYWKEVPNLLPSSKLKGTGQHGHLWDTALPQGISNLPCHTCGLELFSRKAMFVSTVAEAGAPLSELPPPPTSSSRA